jgi:hypothetical protein
MPGCIASNPYATSYMSRHSQQNGMNTIVLNHMNYGYLSCPNTLPTLLALKHHDQSLTNLIRPLCPSTRLVPVDSKENLQPWEMAQAFDWLNDVSAPYTSDDQAHQIRDEPHEQAEH